MNSDELKGNWHILRGRLKAAWAELTDDDLDRIDGNFDQLVGVLQQKTGESRERIMKALEQLKS